MGSSARTLIVQPPFTHEDAWDVGEKYHWNGNNEQEASDETPYFIDWFTLEPPVSIRFIDDHHLMVSYFVLTGDDLDRAIREIRAVVPISERERCLTVFERDASVTEVQHALGALALLAPPTVDPATVAVFHQALTHPNPDVRYVALWATTAIDWSEIETLVRQTVTDPDPTVRTTAHHLVDAYHWEAEQRRPPTPEESRS
jgi:hypothetical protein